MTASHARARVDDARMLVVNRCGCIANDRRARFVERLRAGDLVVANDAATIPASLTGHHARTGAEIEVRLAAGPYEGGSPVLAAAASRANPVFVAVVFGAGDFRTRTEDRPMPPALSLRDRLTLGPLTAAVDSLLEHPRLAMLRFSGSWRDFWAGVAWHGRPVQYAHVPRPLAMWDVWTPIASTPAAFEPPSAGFALDWATISRFRDRGVGFMTLTHAAGLSSTGDAGLDARLPFDEPYLIPQSTAAAIERTRRSEGRIVAVGTTVVRALEHAASRTGRVQAGEGVATGRLGPDSELRVVDAILSGTHEPGTSHYELLRAFTDDETLARASETLEASGYTTHEFGDFMFVERFACAAAAAA